MFGGPPEKSFPKSIATWYTWHRTKDVHFLRIFQKIQIIERQDLMVAFQMTAKAKMRENHSL